jgi:tRNA threonylcarbamoyladenosine biosynthesis protein TsaE
VGVKKKSYVTGSAEETTDLGAVLSEGLKAGDSVGLIGELGAGKTHFVHGIARALRIEGPVTSPSFTIINTYKGPGATLNHIDLYRIGNSTEIDELGLEEYIYGEGISVIEWAEKAPDYLDDMRFVVRFSHVSETERSIEVEERE